MLKSNEEYRLPNWTGNTAMINGFMKYLIHITFNMNGGQLSVTNQDVTVVPGDIVHRFSVKEVFSDITGHGEFKTSDQQDVSEALILIFSKISTNQSKHFYYSV